MNTGSNDTIEMPAEGDEVRYVETDEVQEVWCVGDEDEWVELYSTEEKNPEIGRLTAEEFRKSVENENLERVE